MRLGERQEGKKGGSNDPATIPPSADSDFLLGQKMLEWGWTGIKKVVWGLCGLRLIPFSLVSLSSFL